LGCPPKFVQLSSDGLRRGIDLSQTLPQIAGRELIPHAALRLLIVVSAQPSLERRRRGVLAEVVAV